MIVVTTDQIQGKEIKEILGVMSGGTVQSKNHLFAQLLIIL